MDVETCQILSNIVINSHTLTSLNVSSCNLPANSVGLLLASASSNSNLHKIKLYFANNNLEEQTNTMLVSTSLSRPFPHLNTLDLSSTKLNEKTLISIIEAISNYATGLTTLVLNDLFSPITGHIPGARVAHLLADMTLLLPNLTSLSLANNAASFFGSDADNILTPFLQRMHRNSTVLQLNLSGNRMGDKLAVAVAEMLRYNTCLVDLSLDDNRTTITGFQAIEYSLHRNRTLQKFDSPITDIKRSLTSLSNETKEKKLLSILSKIQLAVFFNRQSNGTHEMVNDPVNPTPRSGPILLFEGQNPPGEGPAIMQTPIPGAEYYNQADNSNNNHNNNNYSYNNSNNNSYSSNNNNNIGYSSGYSNNDGNYRSQVTNDWPVSQPEWAHSATNSSNYQSENQSWAPQSENRISELNQALASVFNSDI